MKYELASGEDFNYSLLRKKDIRAILFTDEVAPKDVELTDLSNDFDGSIVGWKDDGVYKISTQEKGQKAIFNEYCAYMFAELDDLNMIDFLMTDTQHIVIMSKMFSGCKSLTTLDLKPFYTKNVVCMDSMFKGCEKLSDIDLSNFDTSNVKDMSRMFEDCKSLKRLDLSAFDTSKVKMMSRMFLLCRELNDIQFKEFNT